MKNGDQPAYPQHYESDDLRLSIMKEGGQPKGMSKREAFAMAAMQGILSNRELQVCLIQDQDHDGTTSENCIAVYAVKQADELLKALES